MDPHQIAEQMDLNEDAPCPECGAMAYHGLNTVECPTPECKNYGVKQAKTRSNRAGSIKTFVVSEGDNYPQEVGARTTITSEGVTELPGPYGSNMKMFVIHIKDAGVNDITSENAMALLDEYLAASR